MTSEMRRTWPLWNRRIARAVGALAGLVVLLLFLVAVLLLLAPVRERVAREAVVAADRALPGALHVASFSWRALDTIDVEGIEWVDGPDSLISARRVSVSIELLSLLKKDIRLESAIVEGLSMDIPALASRFAAREGPSVDEEKEPRAFPRSGSLAGVPSIAVERCRLTAPLIRITGEIAAKNVRLDGGLDVSRGSSPWVRIDTLAAAGPDSTWGVDYLSLYADPDRGVIKGEGRGEVSPRWPVRFSITPREKDRFKLELSAGTSQAGEERGRAGADLDIGLAREKLRVRSVSFDGRVRTPGTRELSGDPRFAARVEGLPDLDGLAVDVRGELGLEEKTTVDLVCDVERNGWLDTAMVSLKYSTETIVLDSVRVGMPGFSLSGKASVDADSFVAAADLRVTGTASIDRFFPGVDLPEPFSAVVRARVARAVGSPVVRVDLEAEGEAGGFSLESLRLRSDLSLDEKTPSRILLTAETMDLCIGIAADVLRKPDIVARLAPVVVRETPFALSALAFSPEGAGTVRYSTEGGSLFADDLRVTGDFGDLAIDTDLDSHRRGPFSFTYALHTPPRTIAKLLKLTDEAGRRLEEDWAIDAPFTVDAQGELASVAPLEARAFAEFRFPGPRNAAVILPDSAKVGDLGPLEGTLSLSTHPRAEGMYVDATVDLGATEWIDSAVVHLVKTQSELVVDTAGVALEGLRFDAGGVIGKSVYDVSARLAMTDSKVVRRLYAGVPDAAIRGRARLGGTRAGPLVNAAIEGIVKGTDYRVPQFSAVLDLDANRVQASVSAPAGLEAGAVRLDRFDARLSSVGGGAGVFPVRASLHAVGENLAFHQSFQADTVGGVNVAIDTLDLTLGDQDLRARRPFLIRLFSRSLGVSIEDMDLAGSLGTVRVAGFLRPDSSDVAGVVRIELPETPPPALGRPHLWPRSLDLDFNAKGRNEFAAKADVRGLMLVDERRPTIHAEVTGDAEWIRGAVSVGDSLGDVVEGRGRVPASVRIYPPSLVLRDGPISFDASLDRLPVVTRLIGPARTIPKDEIIRVTGDVVTGGTMGSPDAVASLLFEFTDWPKLSRYRARIEAGLGSPAGADTLRTRDGKPMSDVLKSVWGDERGLAVSFALEREGHAAMTARGRYPLHFSLHPARAWVREDGRVDLRFESGDLPLADIDPFLPLDVGLGGLVTVRLDGEGPASDFSLDGSVRSKDFEVSVAEQARVVAETDLVISGSTRRPAVKGGIKIANGLIRVPDVRKDLHAVEGEARLWRDSLVTAAADTVVAEPVVTETIEKRAIQSDIDVSIRIPSGFWIRGKGLDIELGGDLDIRQKNGKPIVAGELRALRGTLVLLGRTLDLERGTVTFYGEDEINPALDIVLTTKVESNKIQILFGGTVRKPQINLTSEPDMSESDIMSVLLFGRTFDDLDDDQAGLVKNRSAEMIASLGAVKLQEELGGQLGVDVVTVTSTGKDQEGTALSFGKYLNARTLLSYAYSLDSESESYVSLEYFLKGRLVVRSTYDNEGVGGLGVGWSKDY